ncbi:ORF3 [torque teno Delphinidae virus 3]
MQRLQRSRAKRNTLNYNLHHRNNGGEQRRDAIEPKSKESQKAPERKPRGASLSTASGFQNWIRGLLTVSEKMDVSSLQRTAPLQATGAAPVQKPRAPATNRQAEISQNQETSVLIREFFPKPLEDSKVPPLPLPFSLNVYQ